MRAGSRANSRPATGARAQPAGGEDAQHVAVRDEHAVPALVKDRCATGDDAVDPGGHVVQLLTRGLARRDGVVPHEPGRVGQLLADLGGGAALPRPVVPLAQVVGDVVGRQAGAAGGVSGTEHRAAEDEGGGDAGELVTHRVGVAFALLGERHVRAAGVAPGPAPLRLPVPDQPHARHGPQRRGEHGGRPSGFRESCHKPVQCWHRYAVAAPHQARQRRSRVLLVVEPGPHIRDAPVVTNGLITHVRCAHLRRARRLPAPRPRPAACGHRVALPHPGRHAPRRHRRPRHPRPRADGLGQDPRVRPGDAHPPQRPQGRGQAPARPRPRARPASSPCRSATRSRRSRTPPS